ncbi:MAG: hypothetical protein R2682_05520 [Pyrinomonadaceae bacterium]
MKDKLKNEFLTGVKEIEGDLLSLGLSLNSSYTVSEGLFCEFGNGRTKAEFLFGPSDWDVEMIIYTPKGKFAFRDLLQIPVISKWVRGNKYAGQNGRNISSELHWYFSLLKFSLSVIAPENGI